MSCVIVVLKYTCMGEVCRSESKLVIQSLCRREENFDTDKEPAGLQIGITKIESKDTLYSDSVFT